MEEPKDITVAVTLAFLAVVPLTVKVASLVSCGGAEVKFSLMGRSGMGRMRVKRRVFMMVCKASSSLLPAFLP